MQSFELAYSSRKVNSSSRGKYGWILAKSLFVVRQLFAYRLGIIWTDRSTRLGAQGSISLSIACNLSKAGFGLTIVSEGCLCSIVKVIRDEELPSSTGRIVCISSGVLDR